MAAAKKSTKKDEESKLAPAVKAFVDTPGVDVEVHLDKDPNDPRVATPAGALPSLNDADQN